MKKVICILFLFCFNYANAQDGTSINYDISRFGKKEPILKMRFIYNDSFAFCYYKSSIDVLKNEKVFSNKLVHHAIFTNKITSITYDEVDFAGKKGLVIKENSNFNWQTLPGTKKILGFECKCAFCISQKNDSTIIWYKEGIRNGLGFLYYNFNLGTPLEIFEYEYKYHYKATKIENGKYYFNLPKEKIFTW